MIKIYSFHSINTGKKLLIFGAIHGNEICGTKAINKIIEKIELGIIKIASGEVIFVPVCNPIAHDGNKRYHEVNLNRVFKKYYNTKNYEEKLANILTEYVDNCDYFLDLHSMASNGKPFVFQDYESPETEEFAKMIGQKNIIKGWPKMYETLDTSDTLLYAHDQWKTGVLIECGKHDDNSAVDVAYNTIENAMKYLGIIEGNLNILQENDFNIIKAKKIFFKQKEGKFIKDRDHLDEIKEGDLIAIYDDGEKLVAENDGYILLPNSTTNIGEEWFYIGV